MLIFTSYLYYYFIDIFKTTYMITHEDYLAALDVVLAYSKQMETTHFSKKVMHMKIKKRVMTPETQLWNANMSARMRGLLLRGGFQDVTTLTELSQVPKKDWIQMRSFGKASISELTELLHSAGIDY